MGGVIMASIINASTSAGLITTADTSGVLQLQTGGTAAVTVNASQNVGIGTASPTQKLTVVGNVAGSSVYTVCQNSNATSNSNAGFLFSCSVASNYGLVAQATDNFTYISNASTGGMIFSANSAERMRIDSSGNLLVNYSSLPTNGARLSVAGDIAAGSGFKTKAGALAGIGGNTFNINWTGSPQLWIDTTNIGTIAFTSDYRIKQNIQTNTTQALERIKQLRPVTYELADYGTLFKEDGVQREGFIAHELQAVIPSAVEGEKDAEDQIQSLKLDALCSVMVKAIQEQQAIINDLKARIETLEGASA